MRRITLTGLERTVAERVASGYRRWALSRRISDPGEIRALAWRRMRSKTYCLLVTTGEDGPSARVLEPILPSDELGLEAPILLGTDPSSRKVREVIQSGHGLLVFQDDRRRSCVVVECRIRVTPEPARDAESNPDPTTRATGRRRAFRAFWRAFWPAGPDGGQRDFVNLECTPVAVEVSDGLAVVGPGPFGRRSARLERDGAGEWRPAA